jgi:hypothetical protein
MSNPVFISYSREASRVHAQALYQELNSVNSGLAFLDTHDIGQREQIPSGLAEALLGARIFVIFLDAQYFERAYCLREFHASVAAPALFPPRLGPAGSGDASVVLALPPGSTPPGLLERVPPHLQQRNWPRADETRKLVELVLAGLEMADKTLGERLAAAGGA